MIVFHRILLSAFVCQYTECTKMYGMNKVKLIIFTVYISKKTLHLCYENRQ